MPTASDDRTAAGSRIEAYVRSAQANNPRIHTVAELTKRTGLARNTLYDWFSGHNEPSPTTVTRVCAALDLPIADFWAIYEGRELEPDSVAEALRRHTAAVQEQSELLRELVGFLRAAAAGVVGAAGAGPEPPTPSEAAVIARAQRRAAEAELLREPRRSSLHPIEEGQ